MLYRAGLASLDERRAPSERAFFFVERYGEFRVPHVFCECLINCGMGVRIRCEWSLNPAAKVLFQQ